MPCWTERTVTVDLNVADEAVLLRALAVAGFADIRKAYGIITFTTKSGAAATIEDGQVQMTGAYITDAAVKNVAGEVKRAYAAEAVRTAAKKYGWGVAVNKQSGQMTLARKAW